MTTHTFRDNLRYHDTIYGVLPGVTTVLSQTQDPYKARSIKQWQSRVGDVEAKRLQQAGLDRGNFIHNQIEDYLTKDGEWLIPYPLSHQYRSLSQSFQTFINASVRDVIYLEIGFASLDGYGGSPDLVGTDENGIVTLFDWKTSGKYKTKSQVKDYFVQIAAYWTMVEQETDVKIESACIVMGYSDLDKGKDGLKQWSITRHEKDVLYAQFLERLARFERLNKVGF